MLSKSKPELKYDALRNQLEKLIVEEKIDFNLDEFEKLIRDNPKRINLKEVLSGAVLSCKNKEMADTVVTLIMNLYQQHPRWKKDIYKPGGKIGKIVSEVIELPGIGDKDGREYNQAIWNKKTC